MDKQAQRFWRQVDIIPGGCWLWIGSRYSNGYGTFWLGAPTRKTQCAHRWAYEHIIGAIPEGLDLDHLCRVRNCVNPSHLEPVTRSENLLRAPARRRKTHCKRGHPLEGDNIYVTADGTRMCIACRRERKRNKRASASPEELAALREREAAYARGVRQKKRGGKPANPNGEKTHCPQGHPYDESNTYIAGGARKCRICTRESNRRAYLKRKSAS